MRGEIRGATVGVMMNDQPDFAVILPLAFLALGVIITLWGLSYARPARFDLRSRLRWRRKLVMVSFIPYSTAHSDAEIEELTGVWRRQQRYFLISGGVGLTFSSLALLVGVLVAPDQALITSLCGSSYGIAALATLSFLVMAISICVGYALHFRHYPIVAAPQESAARVATGESSDTLSAWRRISMYRPWYVALAPWGILALYTAFIVVGAVQLAHAPSATYSFDVDALAERFIATHVWLLGLPIAFAALALIVFEHGVRTFVRSPDRRFATDAEVSRYVNLGLRTQLIRVSLSSAMLITLEMSSLTSFFILVFPFGKFLGIVGTVLLVPSVCLCMMLTQQVAFPKAALIEAA